MVLHEKRQDQVVPNAARGRDLTLMIIIYDSAKSKKPFAIHNHRHRIVLANSFMPNKDGVHHVSMSCTEGVTKRRYRVLCSWWPLVPDNNLLLYSIFNEVELRTYYAKVVGSDRVASRRVRVRVRVVWGMWCEGANVRTCERANVRT